MGRIRPAGVRVLGVPMNKDTAVSLAKAARDVVLRRNVPPEIKEKYAKSALIGRVHGAKNAVVR